MLLLAVCDPHATPESLRQEHIEARAAHKASETYRKQPVTHKEDTPPSGLQLEWMKREQEASGTDRDDGVVQSA